MRPSHRLLAGLALGMAAALPARADDQAVAGSTQSYLGWRYFEQNCARCHGSDATGGALAPNLLVRVKGMSEGRFVATVLNRYQWTVPAGQAGAEGAAREALIADVLQRRRGATDMPAWEGEPVVKAHIGDLYAYLQARASGALAPGRPRP